MPALAFHGTGSPKVTGRPLVLGTAVSVAAPSSRLAWSGPPSELPRGTTSITASTRTATTTTTSAIFPARARSREAFADAAALRAFSRSARVSFFGFLAVVVAMGRPWSTPRSVSAIGRTT